jgi:hypothetical protein
MTIIRTPEDKLSPNSVRLERGSKFCLLFLSSTLRIYEVLHSSNEFTVRIASAYLCTSNHSDLDSTSTPKSIDLLPL